MKNQTLLSILSLILVNTVWGNVSLPLIGPHGETIIGLGQANSLRMVDLSLDGRYIATGGFLGALLWDVETGEIKQSFIGSEVSSVDISPDANQLLICPSDAQLWDCNTGKLNRTFTFPNNQGFITAMFSPDGRQIVTGGYDRIARVWDVNSGKIIQTFSGHKGTIGFVCFSPDGKKIATGSGGNFGWAESDNTVMLWDVESGNILQTLVGHKSNVTGIAFSSDGKLIASGSRDLTAKVWDAETGREIQTIQQNGGNIYNVAFSLDKAKLFIGSDSDLTLWDIATCKSISHFKVDSGWSYCFDVVPDLNRLVTWPHSGGLLALWNTEENTIIRKFPGHNNWVWSTTFSLNGKMILTAGEHVRLWDIQTGLEIKRYTDQGVWITSCTFSPDNQWVAAGCDDHSIKIWNTETGDFVKELSGHENGVNAISISQDGQKMLSGSDDSTARLWDINTGTELFTMSDSTESVASVSISPDGKLGLTGSENLLTIWNLENGEFVWSSDVHSGKIRGVSFSPDGKSYLSVGEDGNAILWSLETKQIIRSIQFENEKLVAVSFLPEGNRILVAAENNLILIDIQTGYQIKRFDEHPGLIWSVAISPDGKWGASGGYDGTVRLWNLQELTVPTPTRTPRPTSTPRPTATPTLPASSNTVITVGSVTAKPGEKIQVPVSIVKSPSVDAFQFELTFDPNILIYQSVSKEGTLSKDFILVDGNVLEPGKVRVAGSAFTAAPFSGDGVIVHVLFQIDASAIDGETPLALLNLRDDIQGAKTVPGKVVISTFVTGDVNGDGIVSAGDAQLAFEFAIGKKQPTDAQIKAGDVDGNGEITAGDAQKIFFLSIGKLAKARGRALSGIFPASAQKVSAITTSGKPGDEIWLPIAVQGANNVLAFTFDLTFDAAALEYQGINYANTLSAAFLLVGGNEVSSGRLRVGGAAFTAPAINGDGTLVLVGFKIKSGASGAYPITLDNLRDDIAGATTEAGQILAGIENTPTPTSTPTPILQVSPTPNGTVIGLQPLRVFPLESTSEFTEIPGGFSNPPAPGGTVTIGEIPKQAGMTDGVGASIETQPGQLGFLMFPSIDVGENTVLIRASVRSDGPGAAVALAVLDGSLDGSIATNIPSNSALFQDEYKRMVLLYDPPGTSIVPVFQISNLQGTQAIQVNLDNYEIYLIPPEGAIPAPLLNGK